MTAGNTASPLTLKGYFEHSEPIDSATTVPQYIGRLTARAGLPRSARDYGRTIFETATRRRLIPIGEDMAAVAFDSPLDFTPQEQIEEAEAKLFALVERKEREGEATYSMAIQDALKRVRAAASGISPAMSTGLTDLDAMLSGGLHPSDLIVLGGRPSMGKTALATGIAKHIAINTGAVGFFSLEMSAEQIAMRGLAEYASVSADKMNRPNGLSEFELAKIEKAAIDLGSTRVVIDQTGGLTLSQLVNRARRMKRKHKICALFIDYLQLIRIGGRSENRTQEIGLITGGLKALAKELNVPVFLVSQLSREVEKRVDRRPQLADLRDSGAIEQDADVVLFVYREEYYVKRERPPLGEAARYKEWAASLVDVAGKAEANVAKHRQGAIGIVELAFSEQFTRFSNLHRGG